MYYTNGSSITKTFHGVTFKPGETKEVFRIINDPKFVLTRQEPPKRVDGTSSKSEVKVTIEKLTGKSATKPAEKGSNSKKATKEKPQEVEEIDPVNEEPSASDVDTSENIEK